MELMVEWLRDSHDTKSLIRICYDETDLYKYTVGIVFALGDDLVMVASVDQAGRFDGFDLFRIEQIARVTIKGGYLESLNKHSPDWMPKESIIDVLTFDSIFYYLKNNNQSMWLVDQYSEITRGFVCSFNDSWIEMSTFDQDLMFLGKELVPIHNFAKISFGGCDQHLLDRLKL